MLGGENILGAIYKYVYIRGYGIASGLFSAPHFGYIYIYIYIYTTKRWWYCIFHQVTLLYYQETRR